mgnify:CR=1 FL=1
MNLDISFMSFGPIIIAAAAYPYVSQLITRTVSKHVGRENHILASASGNGMLRIFVFIVVWTALSFLLAIPLFLKTAPTSPP